MRPVGPRAVGLEAAALALDAFVGVDGADLGGMVVGWERREGRGGEQTRVDVESGVFELGVQVGTGGHSRGGYGTVWIAGRSWTSASGLTLTRSERDLIPSRRT